MEPLKETRGSHRKSGFLNRTRWGYGASCACGFFVLSMIYCCFVMMCVLMRAFELRIYWGVLEPTAVAFAKKSLPPGELALN